MQGDNKDKNDWIYAIVYTTILIIMTVGLVVIPPVDNQAFGAIVMGFALTYSIVVSMLRWFDYKTLHS